MKSNLNPRPGTTAADTHPSREPQNRQHTAQPIPNHSSSPPDSPWAALPDAVPSGTINSSTMKGPELKHPAAPHPFADAAGAAATLRRIRSHSHSGIDAWRTCRAWRVLSHLIAEVEQGVGGGAEGWDGFGPGAGNVGATDEKDMADAGGGTSGGAALRQLVRRLSALTVASPRSRVDLTGGGDGGRADSPGGKNDGVGSAGRNARWVGRNGDLTGGNGSAIAPRDGVCVLRAESVAALRRAGEEEAFLSTACAPPHGGTGGRNR